MSVKPKHYAFVTRLTALTVAFLFCLPFDFAFALDPIIRPYQSVRSVGMGGVRLTTGLYDENFFNNPARITANPQSKFTLLQITPVDVNPAAISAASLILSGKNTLSVVTGSSGNNIHDRAQFILPAYYLAATETRKWALAIGIITSVQSDTDLRQNYQLNIGAISDVGIAMTLGRKFLRDDALSVGLTGHFNYRLGTSPSYSLIDYVRGTPLTITTLAGDGAMINFDLGVTYKMIQWGAFDIHVGGAIQNLLGGTYSTTLLTLFKQGPPPSQPRSYGLGFSANRPEWGFLNNTTFALEITDVLNNYTGSIFRMLHLGTETHWKSIALRLGLNQGYITGGLGLDVHYFTLNLATYGEEMGLNAGTLEDRRYTFDIGFHI